MPVTRISISITPTLVAALDARGSERSTVIGENLERYLYALKRSRAQLGALLSQQEFSLIVDTLNGTLFSEPFSVQILPAEIEDSINLDHLDAKWQVDGPALVSKLQALSYIDCLALVDAAERYWQAVGRGAQPEIAEFLR